MIILWISRHSPTPSQRAELRRLFGPHDLRTDAQQFTDAGEISRRFRAAGGDELVAVAPMTVMKKLLEFGIQPIIADMERIDDPRQAEVTATGARGTRYYRFNRFRRLTGIEMTYEEISPCKPQTLENSRV